MIRFAKDPAATKDYKIDWSSWLQTGETITSQTIAADPGITSDGGTLSAGASGVAATAVTVRISAGTLGSTYQFTSHVTTSAGQQDEFTFAIMVADQ